MKKGVGVIFVSILLILCFGVVSASWFGSFLGKMTGKVVASTDLITYYQLDSDGVSNVNSNYIQGVLYGVNFVAGKVGSAANFNGLASYIDTAKDSLGTGALTICAWINPAGWGGDSRGRIVNNDKTWFYVNNNNAVAALSVTSNGVNYCASAANSISLNVWQYACVSRSSAGLPLFYINGKLSSGSPCQYGAPIAGATSMTIGGRKLAADRGFNGSIDELKIWNRVLTADEIKSEYDSYSAAIAHCSDSDGGINYYIKGNATDSSGVQSDSCYDSQGFRASSGTGIYELYCSDSGGVVTSAFSCPNGCSDGACKNASLPVRDAKFVSQSVPDSVMPGQKFNVSITMANNGSSAWTPGQNFFLGSQSPQDNLVFGLGRVSLNSYENIASGQNKTFTFTLIAPNSAGDYKFQWRMLQENVAWFGEYTPQLVIHVLSSGSPSNSSVSQNYIVISNNGPSVDAVKAANVKANPSFANSFSNISYSSQLDSLVKDNNLVVFICGNKAVSLLARNGPISNSVLAASVSAYLTNNYNMSATVYFNDEILLSSLKDANCSISTNSNCTDSDGGLNYYVKGYLNTSVSQGTNFEDYCLNEAELIERHCLSGNPNNFTVQFHCPNGCVNGACVFPNNCKDIKEILVSEGSVSYSDIVGRGYNLNIAYISADSVSLNINGVSYYSLRLNDIIPIDNLFYLKVSDIIFSSKSSGVSKVDLEIFYSCPNFNSNNSTETCSDLINKVKNPQNFDINGINFQSYWNNTYNNSFYYNGQEYSAKVYSAGWDANLQANYYYPNYEVMVFDSGVSASQLIHSVTSWALCSSELIVDSSGKNNTIYTCKYGPSDYSNTNNLDVYWTKDNVIVKFSWNSGRQMTTEEQLLWQQTSTLQLLEDLRNNQDKYVGGYLDDMGRNILTKDLVACGSDIAPQLNAKNESCSACWSCKTEPVICPEHGIQVQTCRDNCCNSEPKITNQQCSPGICSGCIVPRGVGSDENTCIPYGIRFQQQTSWNIQDVVVNRTDTDGLSVEEALRSNMGLVVYANSSALLTISGKDNLPVSIFLEKGKTYDWSALMGDESSTIKYSIFVNDIVYDSVNYNKSSINVTFHAVGNEQQQSAQFINAYCDVDGQVKQQKTKQDNGQWALCQNNYECDSNFCSGGNCIEVNDMLSQVSGYKSLGVKILCRLAGVFGVQDENTCLVGYLGADYTAATQNK